MFDFLCIRHFCYFDHYNNGKCSIFWVDTLLLNQQVAQIVNCERCEDHFGAAKYTPLPILHRDNFARYLMYRKNDGCSRVHVYPRERKRMIDSVYMSSIRQSGRYTTPSKIKPLSKFWHSLMIYPLGKCRREGLARKPCRSYVLSTAARHWLKIHHP